MVVKTEGKAAFDAGVCEVDLGVLGALDGDNFAVLGADVEVAADAAVGADGLDLVGGDDSLGLEAVGDGRGRAGLGAGAAGDAGRILEAGVETFDDRRVESTALHVEHKFALDLVAGPHAAVAVDALGQVRGHVAVRGVLGRVEVILALGVADLAHADLGGDVLELAVAVHFAGEAVWRMVREHEFDNVAADALDLVRLGEDVRAGHDFAVAGGDDAAIAIGFAGDLDRADAAGAKGIELWGVAEGRDLFVAGMAANKGEDGFAGFKFAGDAVYIGGLAHRVTSWPSKCGASSSEKC